MILRESMAGLLKGCLLPGSAIADTIELERAMSTGRNSGFIDYGDTLVKIGDYQSSVLSLAGRAFTIPNAMIIPVQAGYRASKTGTINIYSESGEEH